MKTSNLEAGVKPARERAGELASKLRMATGRMKAAKARSKVAKADVKRAKKIAKQARKEFKAAKKEVAALEQSLERVEAKAALAERTILAQRRTVKARAKVVKAAKASRGEHPPRVALSESSAPGTPARRRRKNSRWRMPALPQEAVTPAAIAATPETVPLPALIPPLPGGGSETEAAPGG
ncbi:MAG TPA: hypothetical protein VI454_17560 [Verrucomicrobiae bacterium]|jgi:hypothetical protein